MVARGVALMAIYKIVDGRRVAMTAEEEAVLTADRAITAPPRTVSKDVIEQRLMNQGLLRDAYVQILTEPMLFPLRTRPNRPGIDASDPHVIEFLSEIGANPDEILA